VHHHIAFAGIGSVANEDDIGGRGCVENGITGTDIVADTVDHTRISSTTRYVLIFATIFT